MRTFIKGLNLSSRNAVKASRPTTLDEAFDIAIRERDEYLQERRRYPEPHRKTEPKTTSKIEDSALSYTTGKTYGRGYGSNSVSSRQNNFSRAIMPLKLEPTEATSRQYRGSQFDKFSCQTNTSR